MNWVVKTIERKVKMLYRILKRLIGMGKTEGLEEKIDVFYAAGKLTESEYNELTGLIKQ